MKRPWFFLLVLSIAISLLAACSPGGASSRKPNCSNEGDVCVSLNTPKSFVMGEAIPLKITITSSKDIADLYLEINTGSEVTLDGPQTWEKNISNPVVERGVAYGNFSVKKGQSLTFNRVLHFPKREGYFYISVSVLNKGRVINAEDSFRVLLTQKEGGQILLAGTPRPHHTPNVTLPVYGPGTPTPTFETEPPEAKLTPTLEATSTPVGEPYPQPNTPLFQISPTAPPYP